MITLAVILMSILIQSVLPQCEDEYPDCPSRAAAGECHGGVKNSTEVALAGVVECRISCQQMYTDNQLSDIVRQLGGLEEIVKDVFGVELEVCSGLEGMDRAMRYSVLRHCVTGGRAPAWVPSFTETGWKLQHARPVSFNGEFFDNVFVHFKPRDRRWYSPDVMQVG